MYVKNEEALVYQGEEAQAMALKYSYPSGNDVITLIEYPTTQLVVVKWVRAYSSGWQVIRIPQLSQKVEDENEKAREAAKEAIVDIFKQHLKEVGTLPKKKAPQDSFGGARVW